MFYIFHKIRNAVKFAVIILIFSQHGNVTRKQFEGATVAYVTVACEQLAGHATVT